MWEIARKLTLTQRLLALVAVAVLPAAIALAYFIGAIHAEREREVRDVAVRTSQIAALEMERIVTDAQAILETLALAPSVRIGICDDYLDEVSARLPHLRGFAVAYADGTVRCSTGLAFGPDGLAGEPWFAAWQAGAPPSWSASTPAAAPTRPPTCRSRSGPKSAGSRSSWSPASTSPGSASGCASATSRKAVRWRSPTATAS